MSFQNNHPLKSVTLLALFSLNAMAFPLFGAKNTLTNAHAGSSGVIELQKDFNGFYVEADLSYYLSAHPIQLVPLKTMIVLR